MLRGKCCSNSSAEPTLVALESGWHQTRLTWTGMDIFPLLAWMGLYYFHLLTAALAFLMSKICFMNDLNEGWVYNAQKISLSPHDPGRLFCFVFHHVLTSQVPMEAICLMMPAAAVFKMSFSHWTDDQPGLQNHPGPLGIQVDKHKTASHWKAEIRKLLQTNCLVFLEVIVYHCMHNITDVHHTMQNRVRCILPHRTHS